MAITDEVLEVQSLELLSDMQAELHHALSAFGGRQREGLLEDFRFYTASHINLVAEGYIYLRKSKRVDASKHLIRTAIEAVIRLRAIQKKPQLLFRIAFTEFDEYKKWARSLPEHEASEAMTAIENKWAELKQAYQPKYAGHPLVEEKLSLRRMAECAGIALQRYYDSAYRLYCQYTHAAFNATTGNLNRFDRHDNRTMTLCVLGAIETLVSMGALAPNIESLRERVGCLGETLK